MRRRAWLAVVPLLLLAAPVSAAQDDLLLTGTGPAAVEVVLRGSASLDPAAMTFRTTGQVAGLAVLDARGEVVLVTVNARRWVDGAVRPVVPVSTSPGPVRLPPGRYRLVLLGDGQARVRVPATGALARDLRATGRSSATALLRDLREVPAGAYARSPAVLRRGGAVIAVLHQRSTVSLASLPEVCLAEPGAPDCSVAAASSAVVGPVVGDGFTRLAVFLYGDQGAAPRYDLLARAPAVGVVRTTDALLITL